MEFRIRGYRDSDYLFENSPSYRALYAEVSDAIESVGEEDVIQAFENLPRQAKSISEPINRLLKAKLVARGWRPESPIFSDPEYDGTTRGIWRLDFAKGELAVEVAFNHRSDILWNMMKPTLSSELNHVEKAIQTSGGIIITATRAMKSAGGFDRACGTFEDYVSYLKPFALKLTTPLLIVGLEAPRTFRVEVYRPNPASSARRGRIVRL